MLLAPTSVRANAVEAVRVHPADPQPAGAAADSIAQSERLIIAQAVPAPADTPGTYAGKVDRRFLGGEPQATRTYRLTLNPDMNTGKVLIYDFDGKLLNEIGLVGKMTDDRTFEGRTTVINVSPGYKPDNVRLVFSSDHSSVDWYHNDGTIEGSGTLSHSVE